MGNPKCSIFFGGVYGAFPNPYLPVVTKMLKVAASVDTPIPSVYQAGQWVYSPAGLPIPILTGKLACDIKINRYLCIADDNVMRDIK